MNLRRSWKEGEVEGLKMEVLERESVNEEEEVRKKKKRKGEKKLNARTKK